MSERPTLFLLPGLLCDDAVWAAQRVALAPWAEVRIPSLRGFDSFRRMADHVLARAPARFSLAGHSMGARVALELLDMAPGRVERAALLSFGAHPVAPEEPARRRELLDRADAGGLEAVFEALYPEMLHPARRHDDALLAEFRAMVLRHDTRDLRGHVKAALERADQRLYLPRIRHEVLLICGDADEWSPPSQHEDILRLLPRGRLEIVKGAGHMVTMERPDEVSALLRDWLLSRAGAERDAAEDRG